MSNFKKDKNIYVLRLDKGAEIISSIKEFCIQNNIKGASVQGIGFADNIKLGCFELAKNAYNVKTFDKGREITSLLGSVSTLNNDIVIHLHGTFSGDDFSVVGGHLMSATVALTCEIFIQELSEIKRKHIPESVFNFFDFE